MQDTAMNTIKYFMDVKTYIFPAIIHSVSLVITSIKMHLEMHKQEIFCVLIDVQIYLNGIRTFLTPSGRRAS